MGNWGSSPEKPQSSSTNASSPSPKPPTSSSKPKQSYSVDQSSLSSSNPSTSSSKLPRPAFVNPSSSFPNPSTSSSKLPQQAFVNPSSSSPKPPTSSSKPKLSSSVDRSSSPSPNNPSTSSPKLPHPAFANPSSSFPKPSTSSSKLPQPAFVNPSSSSPTGPPVPPIYKSLLIPASYSVTDEKRKENNVWVEKDSFPIFAIPESIKDLIKKDIVPKVLNQPVSPTTYKDYFAALLYAEEYYYEKWPRFDLEDQTLELRKETIYKKEVIEEKTFAEFRMDSFPVNRPFLLSRDLVYVRPSGSKVEPFKGIIHRIVKSSVLLVEFDDKFYSHHKPTQKYDVSISFNRVCLKRAHQAVQTASDALLRNFLFPDSVSRSSIPTAPALLSARYTLDAHQSSAVRHILSIQGSPPYLVAGIKTRAVVCEVVHQLCQTSLENKILICAPSNRCCDEVMGSLLKVIPESDMFRANAAFREIDEVPDEILPSCLYKDPYFSCPPTEKLQKFRVIFSTFMSSFRLHDKGLAAGHFSHIFMVDSSSAIEPETAVALTNFADNNTTVVVTGEPGDRSRWVRADMARKQGLTISYFERLFKSRLYRTLDPMLITQLDLSDTNGHGFR